MLVIPLEIRFQILARILITTHITSKIMPSAMASANSPREVSSAMAVVIIRVT